MFSYSFWFIGATQQVEESINPLHLLWEAAEMADTASSSAPKLVDTVKDAAGSVKDAAVSPNDRCSTLPDVSTVRSTLLDGKHDWTLVCAVTFDCQVVIYLLMCSGRCSHA